MIVVSNTSPITNLAAVARLDLLRELFGTIYIPRAVSEELTRTPPESGGVVVERFSWLVGKPVADETLVQSLLIELDRGEAEAIALTLESGAGLVLMDERIGRRVASRLGPKTIGTLGILIKAKGRNCVPAVKPIVDDLIKKAGFWVGRSLYETVLRTAGEL